MNPCVITPLSIFPLRALLSFFVRSMLRTLVRPQSQFQPQPEKFKIGVVPREKKNLFSALRISRDLARPVLTQLDDSNCVLSRCPKLLGIIHKSARQARIFQTTHVDVDRSWAGQLSFRAYPRGGEQNSPLRGAGHVGTRYAILALTLHVHTMLVLHIRR